MFYLYQPDIDSAFRNRLYLGSDTHAMGLFVGAALACFWNPWQAAERQALARWLWRLLASAALLALGWMMHSMNREDPDIYQGGFLLVPVLTCVVAYTAMGDRRFLLSWLFRTAPMQWLGSRSYSLYLVHWLVFSWMRLHGLTDFSAWPVLAAALLAEALYWCTEVPMKHIDTRGLDNRHMCKLVLIYTAAVLVLFASTSLFGERPARMAAETGQETEASQDGAAAPVPGLPAAPATPAAPAPDIDDSAHANERISGCDDLFAIGDSVLKGAQAHLEKVIPGIRIDAMVGRQASQGLKVVQTWRAAGGKASTVLLHLGTNGYIKESQYRELLAALADRERVILVNVHVPKPWKAPINEIIARMPAAFPNVRVIDWDALSTPRPAYFGKDNTHLTVKGMRALVAQIKEATGGTVIMPASETDTMLAKGNKSPRSAAPAATRAALPETPAARNPAAAHKEASTEVQAADAAHAASDAAGADTSPATAHETSARAADKTDKVDEAKHSAPVPAEAPSLDRGPSTAPHGGQAGGSGKGDQ